MNPMTCLLFLLMTLLAGPGFTRGESWIPPDPDGFSQVKNVEHYGTPAKPEKNGTIYDYMNGGGEIFLQHGLISVTHLVWVNEKGVTLTLDRFTFSRGDQADRALVDDNICPPEHHPLTLDRTSVRSYAYSPEYFLYFTRGPHLYYLYVSDDRKREDLNTYAARLIKDFNLKGDRP